jgi:hypothetical protein
MARFLRTKKEKIGTHVVGALRHALASPFLRIETYLGLTFFNLVSKRLFGILSPQCY